MKKQIIKPFLFVIFLIISIALFSFSSCDGPVDPYDQLKPGRRDYVWEVDTIDVESTYINKIWGSSPEDVWAIGSGGSFDRSIWYFDGDKWTTDGFTRNILPHALWGFSNNEVYIGGLDGKIWNFDGKDWKQFAELEKEGTNFISFENIWGAKPNDFYAVGAGPDNKLYANHSVITHFTDNKWEILDTKALKGNVVHFYINNSDQKKYFRLVKIGGIIHPDSTIIYEYDQVNFKKLYSSVETKGMQADISMIGNDVFFILGYEIATRENNQFKTVLNVDNPNFYQRIWGRNSKDIFLFMIDGLAHYNGGDLEYLFYFNRTSQTQIYGAALFEKEVFFTIYEASTDLKYIYHGKLK